VIYLKNGYDFEINFSTDDFPNSLTYSGDGASTNAYLIQKLELVRNENLQDYAAVFAMDQPDFEKRMKSLEGRLNDLLESTAGIEPEVIVQETESNKQLIAFFSNSYETEHPKFITLKKGEASPLFKFSNKDGKEVSLDEFRGKYVFIDIWATWCAPCKYEFPYLKKMEEEYKNKDLVVISLSVDNPEHKEKWLQMIENENLKGIQLLSDNALHPDFFRAYNVNAIPRFILLDKQGNVLEANAPKPSNPALHELLSSLKL
jgi:thiol-disulfide isomerase/thioredoxin